MESSEKMHNVVRELYPTLTGAERIEAESNLRRYFRVAVEISKERIAGQSGTEIDSVCLSPTMEERSNVSLKN